MNDYIIIFFKKLLSLVDLLQPNMPISLQASFLCSESLASWQDETNSREYKHKIIYIKVF